MIAAILAATTVIAISLYFIGRSSRARAALANYNWLMEFSLVTVGAFIGLLLSLFAHDFLRNRDAEANYLNSLIRIRDLAINHLISTQSIHFQTSFTANASPQGDVEQLQKLAQHLHLLELQSVNRAQILVGSDSPSPLASDLYLSGIETLALVVQAYAPEEHSADNLDEAVEDSGMIPAYLLLSTLAELALVRGELSQGELDTYYRCALDFRRRPLTEQGYHDFCAQEMQPLEDWRRNLVEDEDAADQFDDCLSTNRTASMTICAEHIRRVVN